MTTQSVPAPAALTREAPSLGGFNVTVLRLEIRRLLRNRRTVIFALIFPVVFFLAFGLNKAYANQSAGPGSHGNVSAFSHDQHGPVRGGPGHHQRRGHGLDRAGRGLEPPAPADPPLPGGVHRDQDADRDGPRSRVGRRGLRRGRPDGQALDADVPVDRQRGQRLDRLAGLRRLRPVHGLPAADRERHAVPGPRAGPAVLRRRPVHPAEPVPADCRTSPSSRRSTGSTSWCTRRCSASAFSGPGPSTPWSGWSSSPEAPSGGSARTPPGSERQAGPGRAPAGPGMEPPAGRRSSFCTGPRAGLVAGAMRRGWI